MHEPPSKRMRLSEECSVQARGGRLYKNAYMRYKALKESIWRFDVDGVKTALDDGYVIGTCCALKVAAFKTAIDGAEHNMIAAEQILRLLLDAAFPIDAPEQCCRPLIVAVIVANRRAVDMLLAAGASPDVVDELHMSPLHYAVALTAPNEHIVHALINAGADVNNGREQRRKTPLHIACEQRQPKLVQTLLNAGADASASTSTNNRPIHSLLEHGGFTPDNTLAALRLLLKAGADANAPDEFGRSPTMVFLHGSLNDRTYLNNAPPILRELLDAGARLDIGSARWKFQFQVHMPTVAHYAVIADDIWLLNAYVAHGGDLNARGRHYGTPMFVACTHTGASIDMIYRLRAYGAHPIDTNGNDLLGCDARPDVQEMLFLSAVPLLSTQCAHMIENEDLSHDQLPPDARRLIHQRSRHAAYFIGMKSVSSQTAFVVSTRSSFAQTI